MLLYILSIDVRKLLEQEEEENKQYFEQKYDEALVRERKRGDVTPAKNSVSEMEQKESQSTEVVTTSDRGADNSLVSSEISKPFNNNSDAKAGGVSTPKRTGVADKSLAASDGQYQQISLVDLIYCPSDTQVTPESLTCTFMQHFCCILLNLTSVNRLSDIFCIVFLTVWRRSSR